MGLTRNCALYQRRQIKQTSIEWQEVKDNCGTCALWNGNKCEQEEILLDESQRHSQGYIRRKVSGT